MKHNFRTVALFIKLPPFPSECEYLCWRAYNNPNYYEQYLLCTLNCDIKENLEDARYTLHNMMYQYGPIDD